MMSAAKKTQQGQNRPESLAGNLRGMRFSMGQGQNEGEDSLCAIPHLF